MSKHIETIVLHKALNAIHYLKAETTIGQMKFPGVVLTEAKSSDGVEGVLVEYKGGIHKIPSANIAQIYYGKAEAEEKEAKKAKLTVATTR